MSKFNFVTSMYDMLTFHPQTCVDFFQGWNNHQIIHSCLVSLWFLVVSPQHITIATVQIVLNCISLFKQQTTNIPTDSRWIPYDEWLHRHMILQKCWRHKMLRLKTGYPKNLKVNHHFPDNSAFKKGHLWVSNGIHPFFTEFCSSRDSPG